jgi:hypothetical protein
MAVLSGGGLAIGAILVYLFRKSERKLPLDMFLTLFPFTLMQ